MTGFWRTLFVSAAAAALVWAVSPWVTGEREPWDSPGLYYVGALAAAGGFAGTLAPRPLWAHYVGGFVGQIAYELVALRIGPLFPLGAVFLLGYSLVFAVAAALGAALRSAWGPR